MENRSFDHFIGWLPGADGKQAGLSYVDSTGASHSTFPLAPDFQGCSYNDPDHSYDGSRVAWNNGACDGWLRAGKNDVYSIGYYKQADLPFMGHAAPTFTACDRYFAPILAPTFPNRFYLHAGVTDRLTNAFTRNYSTTIWDRLAAARVRGGYYCGNVNFLLLWNQKYNAITHTYRAVLRRLQVGQAPCVLTRRPELHARRHRAFVRDRKRRPSPFRHPRGRVLPLDDLQRRRAEPGVAAHAPDRHVRRVGRLLRARSPACSERRRPALHAARVPDPLPADLSVCEAWKGRARRV